MARSPMTPSVESPQLRQLLDRLDAAVALGTERAVCAGVKTALSEAVGRGTELLPESVTRPAADRYARRLLHRDPGGRYSVVVMVWGRGQGTPLHDHAGRWCVECVYRGRIRVNSFALLNPEGEGPYRFAPAGEVLAGVSAAGALIPPFEYHTIQNPDPRPAITIHAYCRELDEYNAFVPVDGGYRREKRRSYFTD